MNLGRLFTIAIWVSAVVVCGGCSQNLSDNKSQTKPLDESQIKKVQTKSELFEINGIKAPAEPAQLPTYFRELTGKIKMRALVAGGTAVPYYDIIQYGWISCQANWDETCQGDYPFDVPPGMQMCKLVYTVTSFNNSQGVSATPSNWYANDSENPPRFRSYGLHIWAGGSHTVLNQWGSNIRIDNVGMRVIDAGANNFQRYATGCDMPKP